MNRAPVVFIGGGARSGKSSFALRRLVAHRNPAFIATARPLDDEMKIRITRHREERPVDLRTIEAPRDLCGALEDARGHDAVVVDCLTLWLSNVLIETDDRTETEGEIERLCAAVQSCPFTLYLVSNEVGLGLVPESPLGRVFRDLAGGLHQRLSVISDEVVFAVMGMPLRLKPMPLEILP
jgi:adenosylcobinamide kinase / adenosylcobinamide-phosphate guanylyltransferase